MSFASVLTHTAIVVCYETRPAGGGGGGEGA
jgi:hypothetical protein